MPVWLLYIVSLLDGDFTLELCYWLLMNEYDFEEMDIGWNDLI